MSFLRILWMLAACLAAVRWFYLAVMFTGAALDMNAVPEVEPFTIALAFFGAAMLMIEMAFPSLRREP